jgi:hypothetical protein
MIGTFADHADCERPMFRVTPCGVTIPYLRHAMVWAKLIVLVVPVVPVADQREFRRSASGKTGYRA